VSDATIVVVKGAAVVADDATIVVVTGAAVVVETEEVTTGARALTKPCRDICCRTVSQASPLRRF